LNLNRVNTRGIKQANKHVMMAALTYNIKKLLKFTIKKLSAQVIAMEHPLNKFLLTDFCNAITLNIATLKFLLNPYYKKTTLLQ
jgi:hypothetical protein